MILESYYLAVSRWPSHLPLLSHLSDYVCGTKNLHHPTSLVSLTCRTRSRSSEPGLNLMISLIQPRLHAAKRNGSLSKIWVLLQRKSVVFDSIEKFSARFINAPQIKMRKRVGFIAWCE